MPPIPSQGPKDIEIGVGWTERSFLIAGVRASTTIPQAAYVLRPVGWSPEVWLL